MLQKWVRKFTLKVSKTKAYILINTLQCRNSTILNKLVATYKIGRPNNMSKRCFRSSNSGSTNRFNRIRLRDPPARNRTKKRKRLMNNRRCWIPVWYVKGAPKEAYLSSVTRSRCLHITTSRSWMSSQSIRSARRGPSIASTREIITTICFPLVRAIVSIAAMESSHWKVCASRIRLQKKLALVA